MAVLLQGVRLVRPLERRKLAGDRLLGGILAGVRFNLSTTKQAEGQDATVVAMSNQTNIGLIDSAIVSLRHIMADLRPSVLDDLGLWAALDWQTRDFSDKTGIVATFDEPREEVDIDPTLATSIFRIVQELLTNVDNHTPASWVKVKAAIDSSDIIVTVQDNGQGITKQALCKDNVFGLLSVREQIDTFNGHITIDGSPGLGTKIEIRLPLIATNKGTDLSVADGNTKRVP